MDIPNKFCHNCGAKQIAASKFCSSCGTSLASIDARPPTTNPVPQQTQPNNRPVLGSKRQETFTPSLIGGGEYEADEIRADRAECLADLNIHLEQLDVQVQVEGVPRESMDAVVKSGAALPPGYKIQPRQGFYTDTKATMEQIRLEGSATRSSIEIK